MFSKKLFQVLTYILLEIEVNLYLNLNYNSHTGPIWSIFECTFHWLRLSLLSCVLAHVAPFYYFSFYYFLFIQSLPILIYKCSVHISDLRGYFVLFG